VTQVRVREAFPEDCAAIHELIVALAVYEREPDAVEGSVEDLREHLFGASPRVFCHVAEVRDGAGTWSVAGIAIWYVTFSTWKVRHGIWLEDLFVRPEARGLGLGRRLLVELARIAVERGYPRFEWWVLDWNTPAHGFYESLGAVPQDEWTVWRTDGATLTALGSTRDPSSAEGQASAHSPDSV
jgi:GNAT superfamily N-acetyltransferase